MHISTKYLTLFFFISDLFISHFFHISSLRYGPLNCSFSIFLNLGLFIIFGWLWFNPFDTIISNSSFKSGKLGSNLSVEISFLFPVIVKPLFLSEIFVLISYELGPGLGWSFLFAFILFKINSYSFKYFLFFIYFFFLF